MSHTIEQTREKNPMWIFERNYSYLKEVFPTLIDLYVGELNYKDKLKTVKIRCLEVSRYTTLISLELSFLACPDIHPVKMTIRLYHDAHVADVVSYQNITRLIAPYFSGNKNCRENNKKQANILLYEILNGCIKKQSLQTA